ncbi:MAG TPA: M56 family metallopeptidase [Candidatus Acidoferrales bacterium]|nr:M56 family metallopeptidase [Candidatus Acidoferrales bacterium]
MNNYLASFGPALANHLWQSTAFAAAAWLLTILLRKNSARVRYGIWLVASIKFLIPFSLLIALGGLLPQPTQPVAPAVYAAMKVTEQPFADISAGPIASVVQTLTLTQRIAADIPAILVALWLVGALTILIIWFQRWRKASICLHETVPVVHGRELEILRRLEARVSNGHSSPLRLRLSAEPSEPSIFGIFRSVFVWPERLSERLEHEHIEAIMAHELAHARRFDNATAALHMLVEALFWFHPLAWWMERRMIEERERACDETVLALGARPDAYAEGVLRTCRFCIESPLSCVAGVTGADLKKRVVDIVTARTLMRITWSKKLLLGAAALCVVAAPVLLGQLRDNAALLLGMPAAQQSQQTGSLRFEVAAIKPGRAPEAGMNFRISRVGTTLRLENMPLRQLVEMAFSVSDYALKAPAWLDGQRFDAEAKMPDGGPFSQKDVNEMWLNLLIDRFGMRWHEEQGAVSGYELVSGRKLLLKPSDPADPKSGGRSRGTTLIAGHDMPMSDLATALGEVLGAPVVDNTRISGGFDVNLLWRPDDDQLAAAMAKRMNMSVDDLPSTVFLALQEEAGLKLRRAEVPSRIIVVDNINRQPTDGLQVSAQSPATADWEKAAGGKMAFEVASVKQDKDEPTAANFHSNVTLNAADDFAATGGLFSARNQWFTEYLVFAYKLTQHQYKSVEKQLPASISNKRYDVQGRAAGNPTKDQYRLMMQALLADRFKLAAHFETKEEPVFALVIANPSKLGRQLRTDPESRPCEPDASAGAQTSPDGFPIRCGVVVPMKSSAPGRVRFGARNASMSFVADWLISLAGSGIDKPVIDQTGLGNVDFAIEYSPEGIANPNFKPDANGPSFPEALKDQLGLKLVPTNAPVKTLVIDHIEEPSPN